MTPQEAIKQLKKCKSFYNGSYGTAINLAIKALEQQPNRCDSCVHSEEQDGSNCYECVKGMADYFYHLLGNKPVYLVTGTELDEKGSVNEPLLGTDIEIVKEYTNDYEYLKTILKR